MESRGFLFALYTIIILAFLVLLPNNNLEAKNKYESVFILEATLPEKEDGKKKHDKNSFDKKSEKKHSPEEKQDDHKAAPIICF